MFGKSHQQLHKPPTRVAVIKEHSFYILIAADTDRARLAKPSAYQIAKYRLGRGEWGIRFRTRNRMALSPDDKVLIYVSGHREYRQSFIAHATLASSAVRAPQVMQATIDAPDRTGNVPSEFVVALKEIRFFPNPVHINELKHKFSFVRDPDSTKWGSCLQGGTLRITEPDYNLVLSAGEGEG